MKRYMILLVLAGLATSALAQTPPIQPKVQETPLPPPVELSAPASVPADVPNRPLSAAEAVAIALNHQPDVSVARAGILSARGARSEAASGLLPTATVGASYNNSAVVPTAGSASGFFETAAPVGYMASAFVSQLIFDFNHRRDLVMQSSALVQAASANLTKVQSDLALQVKQAFYTYAQNERLVSVDEANLRNQQSHLAEAKARLNAGVGLPSDVVRAETAVDDAVFTLNLAHNSASVSRVTLAQLLGIDPRTPIVPSDTGEPPIAANDLEALVNQGLADRPDLIEARNSEKAAGFGVSAAKTTNAPSVNAVAGLLQRGPTLFPNSSSLTYGLSLGWTPFDAGLGRGAVQEAQGALQTAQAQSETTRLAVISDVSQAYLNLKTAEQRVATADSEVANAEESLRLMEGRYQSGLGTFLDVLDAQQALLTATTNRVNNQSAVDQARAAMIHAIGGSPVKG